MPIISKESFEKLTQEEKEKLRELYSDSVKVDLGVMIKIFPEEALQPKPLTYEDVARELFMNKNTYWIEKWGNIRNFVLTNSGEIIQSNNCTSRKQAEKLLAINKLLNVCAWADMRNEISIEISAELREKINGIISDEELSLIISNHY